MVSALRHFGAQVYVFDETELESEAWREALEQADVAVARGRHPAILGALETTRFAGVPVVDSASAIEGVRDKRLMTRTFTHESIPIPPTVVGSPAEALGSHLEFPLILKPVFGDNSSGLIVVENEEELLALDWPHPEAIIQEYRPGMGVDLKLYVIDGIVTAVRKPSPITPCRDAHLGMTRLTAELRDLAHRCREAFGLKFFGIDCLESNDHPIQVLEVNDFPNYTLVPYASELLALQVLRRVAYASTVKATESARQELIETCASPSS